MPKRDTTRKRRDNPDKIAYLHHLEQISIHLGAARQAVDEMSGNSWSADREHLRHIGKHIATLYRRAGGNPDATR